MPVMDLALLHPILPTLLFPELRHVCPPGPEPSSAPVATPTPVRVLATALRQARHPSLHLPSPRRHSFNLSGLSIPTPLPRSQDPENACSKPDDDILDIPLDDPGANAAAAKIQASFRGHMARKKIKSGERGRKGPGPGGPGGAGVARGGAGGGPSGD
ncbi:hypothetical protein P7K49_021032 [Saguinus oedipus]|uniref:Neurogranin n=1 Tax=Saguinus oedipus TaxID=9490 RepID=A0ABQ9US75_SAGOE|nr:hypothetical protein P7K49_021032 [Saguinus oedipus]